jgi:hypothetical protein
MVMQHSFQELIGAGGKDDLSRMAPVQGKEGSKKTENSLLLVNHPPINFKANMGHCDRKYAKHFFALSSRAKKDKMGCTSIDAKRTKQQMS